MFVIQKSLTIFQYCDYEKIMDIKRLEKYCYEVKKELLLISHLFYLFNVWNVILRSIIYMTFNVLTIIGATRIQLKFWVFDGKRNKLYG